MICPNCGKEIPDSADFCVFCMARVKESNAPAQTAPVENVEPVETEAPVYQEPEVENKPALIAMICGICSAACALLGFIFGPAWIAALIFDVVGIGLAIVTFVFVSKASQISSNKKATVGLILAIVGIVLSGIGLVTCVTCGACASCVIDKTNDARKDIVDELSDALLFLK